MINLLSRYIYYCVAVFVFSFVAKSQYDVHNTNTTILYHQEMYVISGSTTYNINYSQLKTIYGRYRSKQ